MLNFYNLKAEEFTELSRDILEKITGSSLLVSDSAGDRGADIRDSWEAPKIVAQVKHYLQSTVTQLMASLKTEAEKIRGWYHGEYYLFLSKDLTEAKIRKITELFAPEITLEESHIFTLSRIDSLLHLPEYRTVLQKYPGLWDFSCQVLGEVVYKSVLFDSEELAASAEAFEEFVPTEGYRQCLEALEECGAVLIEGSPGSGKTAVSQMLVQDLRRDGYRVLYSSDGSVEKLKGAAGADEIPELFFLDDFLGQIIYSMEPVRIRELKTLISYIRRHKKKRLILNSRITIYQEALQKDREFAQMMEKIPRVCLDGLTDYEKARIFCNYLRKYEGQHRDLLKYICGNGNYWTFIRHRNFNPRLIQTALFLNRCLVREPEEFCRQIVKMLEHPDEIWEDEFENRLYREDREFLLALYSLSNTQVEYELAEECFYSRIRRISGMDLSRIRMDKVLRRLKRSLVVEIAKAKRYLQAANPSVNDFLWDYVKNSPHEQEFILEAACYLDQIVKVVGEGAGKKNRKLKNLLEQMFRDGTILNYRFLDPGLHSNLYLWHCVVREQRQEERYREEVIRALKSGYISRYGIYEIRSSCKYLLPLFSEPLCTFYQIDSLLAEPSFMEALIHQTTRDCKEAGPVLQAMWERLRGSNAGDKVLAEFLNKARDAWEDCIYEGMMSLDDFLMNQYDWEEYNRKLESISEDMHPDDRITFCEEELYYFLENSIVEQYEDYAETELEWKMAVPPWMPRETAEHIQLNTNSLWIDQDLEGQVEQAIACAIESVVPEEIYEQYMGSMAESRYDMSLNQYYIRSIQEEEEERQRIREIFDEEF